MKKYFIPAAGVLIAWFAVSRAPWVFSETTADLQARINELLAQVRALQASVETAATAAPSAAVVRNLGLGASGGDVRSLQKFLNSFAYSEVAGSGPGSKGDETDYFGPLTENALARWQARNGIPATGYFGPLSLAKYKGMVSAGAPAATVPSPAPAAASYPAAGVQSAPSVSSLSPAVVSPGDTVTITGSGFSPAGNTVIAQFGIVRQEAADVPSADGKTLTFVFSPPTYDASSSISSLPPDARAAIDAALGAHGQSVGSLEDPYGGVGSAAALSQLLENRGRTLDDLTDPYRVVVVNAAGVSSSEDVTLKGRRRLNFGR